MIEFLGKNQLKWTFLFMTSFSKLKYRLHKASY